MCIKRTSLTRCVVTHVHVAQLQAREAGRQRRERERDRGRRDAEGLSNDRQAVVEDAGECSWSATKGKGLQLSTFQP